MLFTCFIYISLGGGWKFINQKLRPRSAKINFDSDVLDIVNEFTCVL